MKCEKKLFMPSYDHERAEGFGQGLFSLFILSVIFLTLGSSSHAAESLGKLSLTDIFLEPTYKTTEGRRAGFLLERSLLGVSWEQDQTFSAKVALGTRDLLNKTIYAQPTLTTVDRNSIGIVEGYAQAYTGYGELRMGLQPILFGYEGAHTEYENFFPNSMFYADRWFPRRDYGASYSITNEAFTCFVAGHNGESSEDLDDRLWLTGRMVWKGFIGSEWGFSGSTARYITPGNSTEERIRMGNVFAGLSLYGLAFNLEGTIATTSQNNNLTRELFTWHADLTHPVTDLFGIQIRYDFLDPNDFVQGDSKREITLGLNIRSRYKTSSFYILGTKVLEETGEYPNDVLRIIWRITPWLVN